MGRDKPHMGGGRKAKAPPKKTKLVLTFDAEKRKEFLTGFSKRKQERRRFGLDMEAFKQKKQLLEARKQRREEQKQLMASLNIKDSDAEEDEEEEEEDADDSDDEEKEETQVLTFDDAHTQSKFGDVVTVTTSVGDLKSDSEDNFSDFDDDELDDKASAAPRNNKFSGKDKEKALTLFQRIQLKRKGLALPNKRAKLKQARESRKAMMGSGKKAGKKGNAGRIAGLARKDDKKGGGGDAGKGGKGGAKIVKKVSGGKKRKH